MFANVDEDDIQRLIEEKDSKNTQRTVKRSVNLFRQFLGERSKNTEFESYSKQELNECLRLFYVSIRAKSGNSLKVSSLNSIKYGLAKFIKDMCQVDVLTDPEFSESNKVFKATVTDMKKKGFGSVDHKPAISSEDLRQLYDSKNVVFNIETPCGLQNKVWFDLMFYLCRRGRENLRNMTKSTFSTGIDAGGLEFVFQAIDEADKNHRSSEPDETVGEARMYSQPGNIQCPVTSFKKYLNKLHPEIDALWQRPLNSFDENSSIWYCKSPLGKNSLSNMMSEISRQGKLSHIYTNHSIRATVITALDNAGVEARHIMRASGHKNEASIRSYACRLNETKKREMSECLGGILGSQSRSNSGGNAVSTTTCNVEASPKENEFPELTPAELDSIFNDSSFEEFSSSVVSNQNVPTARPLRVLNLNAMPTNLSSSTGFHVYPTMNHCVVNFNFGPQK